MWGACAIRSNKTSVSLADTTMASRLLLAQWRIKRVSASSCAALKTLTSINSPNRSEDCTSLSSKNPPPVTIILSGGAWATMCSERNLDRSDLLSGNARKFCQFCGSGTLPFSITRRMGRVVFVRLCLVPDFMEPST